MTTRQSRHTRAVQVGPVQVMAVPPSKLGKLCMHTRCKRATAPQTATESRSYAAEFAGSRASVYILHKLSSVCERERAPAAGESGLANKIMPQRRNIIKEITCNTPGSGCMGMAMHLDMDDDCLLAIKPLAHRPLWPPSSSRAGPRQNYHNCRPSQRRTQYFRCENNECEKLWLSS